MSWFVKLFNNINIRGILGSIDDLYSSNAGGFFFSISLLVFSIISLKMIRNEKKAFTWLRIFGVLFLVLTALYGLALPISIPICILLVGTVGKVFHFC